MVRWKNTKSVFLFFYGIENKIKKEEEEKKENRLERKNELGKSPANIY